MKKVASMIVKLFVPEVTAGACPGEAGCCCNNRRTKRLTCHLACVRGQCTMEDCF
jgi:hypothetical protein